MKPAIKLSSLIYPTIHIMNKSIQASKNEPQKLLDGWTKYFTQKWLQITEGVLPRKKILISTPFASFYTSYYTQNMQYILQVLLKCGPPLKATIKMCIYKHHMATEKMTTLVPYVWGLVKNNPLNMHLSGNSPLRSRKLLVSIIFITYCDSHL